MIKKKKKFRYSLFSSCEVVSSLAFLIRSSLATYTLSNALEAITNFFLIRGKLISSRSKVY